MKKGMSAIAALFMIIFNDEQAAFWALCSFMIKTPWTQKGMFLPGFPKLNHFTSMWEKILETTMPKISRHFEEEGVIPQIYLTKWFLQNFLDRLPFHLCIRLWDLFLLEGEFGNKVKLKYLVALGNINLEHAFIWKRHYKLLYELGHIALNLETLHWLFPSSTTCFQVMFPT